MYCAYCGTSEQHNIALFQNGCPFDVEGLVTWKGLEAVTLLAGLGASRSCPKGFFAILHGRHVYKTFLIAC